MKSKDVELEVKRQIDERNEKFSKATDAQKRVLIAKDVLERIGEGKFKVSSGTFLTLPFSSAYDVRDEQLQTAWLSGAIPNCSGCALGGLLLSCTLYNDKLTVDRAETLGWGRRLSRGIDDAEHDPDEKLPNGLDTIFEPEQLRLIEKAFELGLGAWRVDEWGMAEDSDDYRAVQFGKQNRYDPTKRLIAIMQNIVDNEGTFKP